MKILKYLLVQILACLIMTAYTIGQSTFNIVEGGKVNIKASTELINENLTIGTGSQLANRGNLTVNGVLVNDAGTPGLLVKADENGSGSLLHNTANIPGSMELYLTSECWHLVSSPMANATIETYLDIYLKKYDETDSSWTYLVQPLSMPMNATSGYSAWVSDDLTGTTTVTYDGNLNNGDYTVQLTYTPTHLKAGYNLIGNPYPSPIDWNADTSWNRNFVGGWAVVYDNTTFRGWNPFLTGDDKSYNGKTDGMIAATQGFWVKAYAGSATLTIPQSQRKHSNQEFYKESEISNNMSLRLKASANNYEDEAVIIFMDGATEGFDGLYDLGKFYNINESPNVYSVMEDNLYYSVNVLPGDFINTTSTPVIPVGFLLGVEKECTFSASGIESFDWDIPIFLEDLKEGNFQDLRLNPTYTFSSGPLDNPNRFLIHFAEPNSTEELVYSGISIYSYGNDVYVKLPSNTKGSAEVYDLMGKKITTFNLNQELTKKSIGQTGYFIVKVKTSDLFMTQKVFIKN